MKWWILGICALVAFTVWAAIEDEKDWESYSTSHHCRAAGTKAASNGFGTGSKGEVVITYNPAQTIYQCDAGEIVIK